MILELNLQTKTARLLFCMISIVFFALVLKIVISGFTVGTLADRKTSVPRELLASAINFFPDSDQITARLAEMEMRSGNSADLEKAENHAARAVLLSPKNYSYQMMLANIREMRGNQAGAEESFKAALNLAPNYAEVQWRLANALMRQGKFQESYGYFRSAAALNSEFLPPTLDLVWNVSGKNLELVKSMAGNNANARLKLALFLVNQSHAAEASEILTQIDAATVKSSPDSFAILERLISKGFTGTAFNLWAEIYKTDSAAEKFPGIWNGDFEAQQTNQKNPFDWQLGRSDYARFSIDNRIGHSGNHSMLVTFLGRDTTRISGEVKQMMVVLPKTEYQLTFYAQTENFQSPEGPHVIVVDKKNVQIAASEAIDSENSNWKKINVNFMSPPKTENEDAAVLFISLKRIPRFTYDEPTRGNIRLDDFAVSEVKGK